MVIIYFSGTGNSKYIAEQFAKKMDVKCHSIEEKMDFDHLFSTVQTIAVCYPIYGSCVPRIMREFVEKYKKAFESKKLIIFCTQMMFSGDGAKAFARLIPDCDKHVIYAEHFNMPNNICNFFLFPIRERERIKKTKAADKKLEIVCHNIKNGIIKRRGWGTISSVLGKLQSVSFAKREGEYRSSFIADHDCIRCGLCVQSCPMNNLTLTEERVAHNNNCTLCYRCVNICPKQAATIMIHTKPKRQYRKLNYLEEL